MKENHFSLGELLGEMIKTSITKSMLEDGEGRPDAGPDSFEYENVYQSGGNRDVFKKMLEYAKNKGVPVHAESSQIADSALFRIWPNISWSRAKNLSAFAQEHVSRDPNRYKWLTEQEFYKHCDAYARNNNSCGADSKNRFKDLKELLLHFKSRWPGMYEQFGDVFVGEKVSKHTLAKNICTAIWITINGGHYLPKMDETAIFVCVVPQLGEEHQLVIFSHDKPGAIANPWPFKTREDACHALELGAPMWVDAFTNTFELI